MERVLGIGGHFIRANDPSALSAWYREALGLDVDENRQWSQEPGPTVFATFERDSDYFGPRSQQVMFNFHVRDLDAMLAQLREHGATITDDVQDMAGVGRFGWHRALSENVRSTYALDDARLCRGVERSKQFIFDRRKPLVCLDDETRCRTSVE
jgi:predicted enzyme related to lactoylglutathione lyase